MPRTYLDITSSTDTIHSYSTLNLLDQPSLGKSFVVGVADHDTDETQLRLFKNTVELVRPGVTGAEYSINETTKDITLTSALISSDRLLIVRQTRRDRPYVIFTNSARLKKADEVELFLDQVLFIIQELNEEEEIQTILTGLSYPDAADRTGYNATVTGSTSTGPFSYAAISLLRDDRVRHADQLLVLKNGIVLTITTDYTIDAVNEELTLIAVLVTEDNLEIRRQTSLDRYVSNIPDGSSHSSDIVELQFNQIENLVQELPHQLGLDATAIRTYRNPRRKTFITYSGPGDRFYYGNLPWYPDGSLFVWKDSVLLTDPDDYSDDSWQDIIDLITSLTSSESIVISVAVDCTFPILFCNGFGDWGDLDPDNPLGSDDSTGTPSDPDQSTGVIEQSILGDSQMREGLPDSTDDTNVSLTLFPLTGSNISVYPVFEFDVSNVDVASFENVNIRMTARTDSSIFSAITELRRSLRTVVIDEVTWNSFASGSLWGASGAQQAGIDYDSSTVVAWTTGTVDVGTVITSPNIKAMALAAKNDDGILRIVWSVDDTSPGFSISFWSNEASVTSNRPRIQFSS